MKVWQWSALMAGLAALVLHALPARAEQNPLAQVQSLGDVRYHQLDSNRLGRSFHLIVRLPPERADPSGMPATYLLDGGATFALASGITHYLALGDELPPIVLVAISYGATTFREGNMRQTDFTAPSEDRDFWGGAGVFRKVLLQEVIPLIEERYGTDPRRRVLFGHSLGGQFVLHTALTRPEPFYALIASSPALHLNLPFFLQWRGVGAPREEGSMLFVTIGEHEDPQFLEPALEWMAHWRGAAHRPWQLETRTLPGQTHFSIVPEAFIQGLKWTFRAEMESAAGEP